MTTVQMYEILKESINLNTPSKPKLLYGRPSLKIYTHKNIAFVIYTLDSSIIIYLYENEAVFNYISSCIKKNEETDIQYRLFKCNNVCVATTQKSSSTLLWVEGSWVDYIKNYFKTLESEISVAKEQEIERGLRAKQAQRQKEQKLLKKFEKMFAKLLEGNEWNERSEKTHNETIQ